MLLLNIDILTFYHDDNKAFNEQFLTPFKLFCLRETKKTEF